MSQPSKLPEWNSGVANQTEPSAPKKVLGWVVNEAAASSYFNWILYTIYLWCVYLKNLASEALTWTALQTFNEAIVVIATTGTNVIGGMFTGKGNQSGVSGQGGASAGAGGSFAGGASSGPGIVGVGGTGGGVGGQLTPSTAATTTVHRHALEANFGHVKFTNAVNPLASTAALNILTPKNVCKAWGSITLNGTGTPTVNSGFNIDASPADNLSNTITVYFAQDMANANYSVTTGSKSTGGFSLEVTTKNAHYFIMRAYDVGTVAYLASSQNGATYDFQVYGEQ